MRYVCEYIYIIIIICKSMKITFHYVLRNELPVSVIKKPDAMIRHKYTMSRFKRNQLEVDIRFRNGKRARAVAYICVAQKPAQF